MKEITASNLLDCEFIHLTCSNETIDYYYVGSNPDSNAKMAIENADALIKRLNKQI